MSESQRALQKAARARPESEIVRATLQTLPTLGVIAWRNQSGMIRGSHKGRPWAVRMSMPGVSDIVGFTKNDGRIVCIECKRPGQHLTREQDAFLETVNLCGGIGFKAESVDDVVRELAARRGR